MAENKLLSENTQFEHNNGGDEADKSSALEEYERDSSLKKALQAIPRSFPPDFDGCCIDCGEELPEVRLKLFCVRCVDCQTILEKQNKHKITRTRIDSFGNYKQNSKQDSV